MAITGIGRFFSQATHQGQIEIYPENEHQFLARAIGAQMTFETDPEGRVKGVIGRQGNRDMHGERLNDATAKAIADEMAASNKKDRERVEVSK